MARSTRRHGGWSGAEEALAKIQALRADVGEAQKKLTRLWRPQLRNRTFLPSAANLAAYVALRRHDLRALQKSLSALGLSSLGRCEGRVLATLDAVIHALQHMLGEPVAARRIAEVTRAMERDQVLLRHHTNVLLGLPPRDRWTRFMVTLPAEAAEDYLFVRDLLTRGMDCARINCAHDDAAAWEKMAAQVRRAQKESGRPCKILMDLAGPKLRTGPVAPGPAVLRVRVKRDAQGETVQHGQVILDASGAPGCPDAVNRLGQRAPARLSVNAGWLEKLKPGDAVAFEDLRKRQRRFAIVKRLSAAEVLASCAAGAYLAPGTRLLRLPKGKNKAAKEGFARTGDFTAPPAEIRVFPDDLLLLTRDPAPGEPEKRDASGEVVAPAHISCSEAGIFASLKEGHKVWIDDGRIGAVVEEIDEDGAWLRISRARSQGERIGADKGLNFPDTPLTLPALNADDLAALDCAVKHADLVGLSFVQNAGDIDRLSAELKRRGKEGLGIVAKIETRAALQNLPEIIIHGAGRHPFGVMIARGDLAVEIGYERLAEIQEEILWLCEAAHVPVIWATQVLESLVKQDIPSRAEITDAAMAERAECVMLNKGPYILDALAVLDSVVTRMQFHQSKKTAQFRALHW